MARKRSTKPYLHEASGFWCMSQNRKRIYLDKDYKVACRKMREVRATEKLESQGVTEWFDSPFAALADEFLEDIKARKSESTHQAYRYRLLRALRILGTDLRVAEVKKLHLAKIEGAFKNDLSPTTVKDTIATVQTVFSWAVKHDLVTENPLVGYEKPRGRTRNRIVSEGEFKALREHSDVKFRRVLWSLRLTGCRPGEIRSLIWEWVDLETGFWIFPVHKTITQQRQPKPRIIPLPPRLLALCHFLSEEPHKSSDFVFTNAHGAPYSKDCFCRKMARLRTRAGIETKSGEDLVLYSNRHTYGTNAAGKVSDMELAELMGHTDTRTTRRYVHLNADRLQDIQRKIQR